jgi:ABC-type glycerol-3-phosphate transport system substrate-binding protein
MDNTFQIIILGAFIIFALIGVVLFASPNLLPNSSERQPISFTVWGEWDSDVVTQMLDIVGITDDENVTISYTSVPSDQFQERIINALARGEGPDVVLLPHTKLLPLSDLTTVIGEDFYPARQFRNTFVEGSEVFLSSQGVRALPLAVDPLVMYWNRDILTKHGYTSPPKSWSETSSYIQQITQADDAGNISTAGIALGTVENISYVKEILSSLFLQAGSSIVTESANGVLVSSLRGDVAVASAIGLYVQYANPDTSVYTWNNSFASDLTAFTSGQLAFYLAPASQINKLRQRNPNLNFDVTSIPQLSDGQRRGYGDFYGFAILNRAPNKAGILTILQELTAQPAAEAIARNSYYTPVRKSVLAAGAGDPYSQVFFDAAVISRGWLEPDSAASREIFSDIIRDVTSGRRSTTRSLLMADTALGNLLDQFND